jgi:tartrate/fumarate subfamily iron-sulfur-dependent hydro-lyase beta chain
LSIPLSEQDVRALSLGDIVSLDGVVYTGRTRFHVAVLEESLIPPLNFEQLNVFHHVGPVMRRSEERDDGWEPLCVAATASMRFEKYGPELIRKLGLRAIIGKGTMGPKTMKAMRELGCVHLCAVGMNGNVLATKVRRILGVHNLEVFGSIEATWVLEVEDFGPWIVDIDTEGRNLFHSLERETRCRASEVFHHFDVMGESGLPAKA